MTQDLPTQLGPYRIRSRLAVGGMAEVFLARRVTGSALGPKVALKRLLPHLQADPAVVRMFVNEARITAQIVHPNVIRILEMGEDAGQPFIAMELLDGGTFAQLREKAAESGKRVPLEFALRILVEACRGLDAAHRATDDQGQPLCIVHRDFTPDNVHVGVSGAIKVLDFGIAKSVGTPGGTEPGTLKGKYFYMSPEMIRGEPLDHRADVFAAGVMLYEQLCGHRPFTGNNTGEILVRIAQQAPRRPSELDPSVPLSLEQTCLRALSSHPADRFGSLFELAEAIEALPNVRIATAAEVGAYVNALIPRDSDERVLLERARVEDPSLPPHPLPELPKQPKQKTRSRRPKAGVAAGVLLLALVGGGGWYALKRGGPASPAERLAQARSHPDGKQRLVLAHLDEDPRATLAQLSEAGHLLLLAHADRAALELSAGFQKRAPKNLEALLIEARAAIALRYGKRAEAALDRAGQLYPQDPRPDEVRADLKTLQGDLPGALAAIEEASRKGKGPHLVVRRADLLVRLSRLDEARKVTTDALERGFSPEIAAEKAFIELQQGRTHDAMALLRRVLRADDSLAPAHYYLGAALQAQGDLEGAERELGEADRLAPDDTRALQALIALARQQKDEGRAQTLTQTLEARTAEAE